MKRTNERTNEHHLGPLLTRVVVPRAKLAEWCHRPWSEVLAAAELGDDGLRVHLDASTGRIYPPRENPPSDWREIAFLREGVGMQHDDPVWGKDRTLLYQQNW